MPSPTVHPRSPTASAGMELYKPDEESLALHPADAARLGIADNDLVRVTSAHGSDTFLAQISTDLPPGIVHASINPAHGSPLFPGKLPAVKAYPVEVVKL